ncbi:MAG: GTPase HflX, partial [Zavarzinia sp.]|nr:GTPase HflX [Zavarzinia sp.]
LSDTVGFVSDLPHQLVAAFRATLEEVLEADIIVHVRDVSHPEATAQQADVLAVLEDLGLGEETLAGRMIEALNKIDLLDEEMRTRLANMAARIPTVLPVSALTGEGVERLLAVLDERLSTTREFVELEVDLSDGAALAFLYRHGEVIERKDQDNGKAHLTVGLDPADLGRLEKLFRDSISLN